LLDSNKMIAVTVADEDSMLLPGRLRIGSSERPPFYSRLASRKLHNCSTRTTGRFRCVLFSFGERRAVAEECPDEFSGSLGELGALAGWAFRAPS